MAFIKYIKYEDASDKLKKLYEQFGGPSKTPANVVRIAGPNPDAMDAHLQFYRAVMSTNSAITRDQQEMIAVVVSSINQCHY